MINTSGRMHMSSHLVISASASHVHGKVFQAAGEQLESSWRKNLVVIWRSLFDRTHLYASDEEKGFHKTLY